MYGQHRKTDLFVNLITNQYFTYSYKSHVQFINLQLWVWCKVQLGLTKSRNKRKSKPRFHVRSFEKPLWQKEEGEAVSCRHRHSTATARPRHGPSALSFSLEKHCWIWRVSHLKRKEQEGRDLIGDTEYLHTETQIQFHLFIFPQVHFRNNI